MAHARPNRLITLTCRPSDHATPRAAFDALRRQVSVLARELRASLGEFEYLRVLESTARGWPHFHLVARSPYVHHSRLSAAWQRLANAPVVDIRKINDPNHTVRYIVKYLSKQDHVDYTERRLSWSKRFFRHQEENAAPGLDLQQIDRSKLHWTVYFTTYLAGEEAEHIYAGVFGLTGAQQRWEPTDNTS
ncbi:MAG: hypothetical protein K6T61_18085 [Bryobacteraceae bacterium]|nr:hypothetical protein [Bryobacteraceae bacterium]